MFRFDFHGIVVGADDGGRLSCKMRIFQLDAFINVHQMVHPILKFFLSHVVLVRLLHVFFLQPLVVDPGLALDKIKSWAADKDTATLKFWKFAELGDLGAPQFHVKHVNHLADVDSWALPLVARHSIDEMRFKVAASFRMLEVNIRQIGSLTRPVLDDSGRRQRTSI